MRLLPACNGDSRIHRLDPRVKLVWLLGNLALAVMSQGFWLTTWILVSACIATVSAGISLREFVPLLKVMVVIGAQIVLLQGLLRHEGPVLCRFGVVTISAGGLVVGLKGVVLLLAVALLFLQFVMWTSPEELTLVLVKVGFPHRYAVLVGMALRFMPIVERDLASIHEGRQARGLPLETTWQVAKGLVWVTVPLILRTIKRANDVAMSMELKGFSRYHTRTFLRTLEFSTRDRLVLWVLAAYFTVALSLASGFVSP